MHSYRTPFALCILGLATLPFLAGCGGGGGGGGGTTDPIPPTTASVSTTAGGLKATLTESATSISPGAAVTYTYTLTNTTTAPITINSASTTATKPSAAVGVLNGAGALVYASLPPPPPLTTAPLAAGRSITSTEIVSFGAAGTYTATAKFGDLTPVISVGPLTLTVK